MKEQDLKAPDITRRSNRVSSVFHFLREFPHTADVNQFQVAVREVTNLGGRIIREQEGSMNLKRAEAYFGTGL